MKFLTVFLRVAMMELVVVFGLLVWQKVQQEELLSPVAVTVLGEESIASTSGVDLPETAVVADETDDVDEGLTRSPTPVQVDLASQVGQHATTGDCWILYQGHVYNISSYFGKHPGGDAMLARYCGQDATNGFLTKDKNPPTAHSAAAVALLENYRID